MVVKLTDVEDEDDVLGLSVISKSPNSPESELGMSKEWGSTLTFEKVPSLDEAVNPAGRWKPRSISLSQVPPISSSGIASEECCIVGGLRIVLRDDVGGGGPFEEDGAEKGYDGVNWPEVS